ncbi:FAD-binding domain-containing protein [Hypoxylon rubiginosum]|uniref:FAD-binding domain-containing protein n=1 Tax=Hypoxylon rubiginosum TaxID=110542 RepID=A0ACB9Z8Y4_9PEZI|nr:FAD-binding domain-containing protein [Hypoxylon rubiginosum]
MKSAYLPINGGHGAITTIGELNTVKIADDGKSAQIGGVALTKTVTDALWAAGKQTSGCHGFHQGRYELIADQFLLMNIVLAGGSMQTIDETSDLWWAMKGAGHNFGVVTSVTSKIYDPKEVVHFSCFINLPDVDPNNAVILFFIIQGGVQVVDPDLTSPFVKLEPVTLNSNIDAPCQKVGLVNTRFTIDVETYDTQAQRKVYDMFSLATHETPALDGSLFLFEGYSLQAVQAVPRESTAISYQKLQQKAAKLSEDLRQIIHKATGRKEMHTYVNYAFGTETKEQIYGHEEWRRKKLLHLKNKYNPDRKFSFYAPIA